jgi:hypothetical protein
MKLCGLLLAVALTAAGALALTASKAAASSKQITMIQDNSILSNPAAALPQVRALGASTVRVFVPWYTLAPRGASKTAPKGFKGSNPNSYPKSKWAPYDQLVKTAKQDGITVDLELTGGSPRWASGKNPPKSSPGYTKDRAYFSWEPNAKLYGQFVHAVAERYSGHFKPKGSNTALPRVHFWSFWNEPNFGQDLGPQATNGSTVAVGSKMYRALLNAGWKAMQQTGHGHDTLLFGELAAKGYAIHAAGHPGNLPGNSAQTRSLDFLRFLYCLDANYHKLRGRAATQVGCPANAAGSRRFRAQNPALFNATGFADHAYDSKEEPDANPASINANYATFPVLKRVAAALDRVTHAYGSGKRFPIYNDEFGYITSPPQRKGAGDPSPAKAAVELNQAEYLSYKNPRVAAYSQYLIADPKPYRGKPGFSSGLYTSKGKPKPALAAFRLPLWMPRQTVHAGAKTEIWGGARPASFGSQNSRAIQIQMQKGGKGSWTTVQTVTPAAKTGYFDVHTKLPYSGKLRLAYTYPQTTLLPGSVPGTTIFGRTVTVKVTG